MHAKISLCAHGMQTRHGAHNLLNPETVRAELIYSFLKMCLNLCSLG